MPGLGADYSRGSAKVEKDARSLLPRKLAKGTIRDWVTTVRQIATRNTVGLERKTAAIRCTRR